MDPQNILRKNIRSTKYLTEKKSVDKISKSHNSRQTTSKTVTNDKRQNIRQVITTKYQQIKYPKDKISDRVQELYKKK